MAQIPVERPSGGAGMCRDETSFHMAARCTVLALLYRVPKSFKKHSSFSRRAPARVSIEHDSTDSLAFKRASTSLEWPRSASVCAQLELHQIAGRDSAYCLVGPTHTPFTPHPRGKAQKAATLKARRGPRNSPTRFSAFLRRLGLSYWSLRTLPTRKRCLRRAEL